MGSVCDVILVLLVVRLSGIRFMNMMDRFRTFEDFYKKLIQLKRIQYTVFVFLLLLDLGMIADDYLSGYSKTTTMQLYFQVDKMSFTDRGFVIDSIRMVYFLMQLYFLVSITRSLSRVLEKKYETNLKWSRIAVMTTGVFLLMSCMTHY